MSEKGVGKHGGKRFWRYTRIGLVEQGAAVEWHRGRDIYHDLEDEAIGLHYSASTRLMKTHAKGEFVGSVTHVVNT